MCYIVYLLCEHFISNLIYLRYYERFRVRIEFMFYGGYSDYITWTLFNVVNIKSHIYIRWILSLIWRTTSDDIYEAKLWENEYCVPCQNIWKRIRWLFNTNLFDWKWKVEDFLLSFYVYFLYFFFIFIFFSPPLSMYMMNNNMWRKYIFYETESESRSMRVLLMDFSRTFYTSSSFFFFFLICFHEKKIEEKLFSFFHEHIFLW